MIHMTVVQNLRGIFYRPFKKRCSSGERLFLGVFFRATKDLDQVLKTQLCQGLGLEKVKRFVFQLHALKPKFSSSAAIFSKTFVWLVVFPAPLKTSHILEQGFLFKDPVDLEATESGTALFQATPR